MFTFTGRPITRDEAITINPHLLKWEKDWSEEGRGNEGTQMNFYTCTKHDTETNKCMVHEERPRVCSNYPWYGRGVKTNEAFYNPNCGYKVDVDEELKLLTLGDEDEEE